MFSFYVDAPDGCSAAEFNLITRNALRRRYESLRELLPDVPIRGPWVSLTKCSHDEALYTTEATLNVRRGSAILPPAELAKLQQAAAPLPESAVLSAMDRFPRAPERETPAARKHASA